MAQTGFYNWLVLLICLFVCQNIDNTFNWLNSEHLGQVNATAAHYRRFSDLSNAVSLVCGPLTFGLTRRFETRTVIIATLATSLLTFTLAPFWKNFYFFLTLQGIIAKIATGCAVIGCIMTIGTYFNSQLPFAASSLYFGRGVVSVSTGFLLPTPRFVWLGKFIYTICALTASCLLAVCLKQPSDASKRDAREEAELDVSRNLLSGHENRPKTDCVVRVFKGALGYVVVLTNWKFLFLTVIQTLIVAGNVTALSSISMTAASMHSEEGLKLSPLAIVLIAIAAITLPLSFVLSTLIYKKIISALHLTSVMVLATLGVILGGFFCSDPPALFIYSLFLIIRTTELDALCLTYIKQLLGQEKFPQGVSIVETFKAAGNIIAIQFVWYSHVRAAEDEGREEFVSENPLKELRKTLFIFSIVSYSLASVLSGLVSLATKLAKHA